MRGLIRELEEGIQGGFDTAMRTRIMHAVAKLKKLSTKPDDKDRAEEQTVLNGLIRDAMKSPEKFVYSVLEIMGARGNFKNAMVPGRMEHVEDSDLTEWGGRRRGGGYSRDPYLTKAKAAGVDAKGLSYKKGEEIMIYKDGAVYAGANKDKAWREFQAAVDDERFMSGGY